MVDGPLCMLRSGQLLPCMQSGRHGRTRTEEAQDLLKATVLIGVAAMLATCSRPPSMLEQIRESGELRVVTLNSPMTFYYGPWGAEGPEYDLLKGFANHLNVDLHIVAADRYADLLRAIEGADVHLAAAGLGVTAERASRVDFGPAYQRVEQLVVVRRGRKLPRSPEDLVGRRGEVVARSAHVETLEAARKALPGLVWVENPVMDTGQLLAAVARGQIDYTVVDSNILSIYQSFMPELRVAFELGPAIDLAWAFPRQRDDSLRQAAAEYLAALDKSGDLAHTLERYYQHKAQFDYVGTRKFSRDYERKLPVYEPMFRKAGERHDLDWRLLAAAGYQESHWNPKAVSHKGAIGVMMLMRDTADLIGIKNPFDPAQSIEGGARYLRRMLRLVPDEVPEPDRFWMALAAYNMGYGHLIDARALTASLGGDKNKWSHVRRTLPLLMQPQWYSKARWGYARGVETVDYVDNVRNYYQILLYYETGETAPGEPLPEPKASATTAASEPSPAVDPGS